MVMRRVSEERFCLVHSKTNIAKVMEDVKK